MAADTFEVEDLTDLRLRSHFEKVRLEGTGTCSKCRWMSGCRDCDPVKCWMWVVSKELGMSRRSRKAIVAGKGEKVKEIGENSKGEEVKQADANIDVASGSGCAFS